MLNLKLVTVPVGSGLRDLYSDLPEKPQNMFLKTCVFEIGSFPAVNEILRLF